MIEEWRAIPSLAGYEASSLGQIRSVDRVIVTRRGLRKQRGKIRKACDNGAGYMHLHITKGEHHYVHCLVAEAFLGKRPPRLWVCHSDGQKQNNCPNNLRYATAKENEADKKAHGTRRPEKSNYAVLTLVQVKAVKLLRALMPQSELALVFNVSQPTISRILSGRCWK